MRPLVSFLLTISLIGATFPLHAGAASPNASASSYSVDFRMTTNDPVTHVQVEIDSAAVPGAFHGPRTDVACAANPGLNALAAFYRCDPSASSGCTNPNQLNAAMVLPAAITGDVTLFTCTFDSNGQVPVGRDFAVRLVDAGRLVNGVSIPAAQPRVSNATVRASAE